MEYHETTWTRILKTSTIHTSQYQIDHERVLLCKILKNREDEKILHKDWRLSLEFHPTFKEITNQIKIPK